MKSLEAISQGNCRGSRPRRRLRTWVWLPLLALALVAGCAKYNTFFNAQRSFDQAEYPRNDAIKNGRTPPKPSGQQKSLYEQAAQKAQKVLDEYPGHSLTDDALFLQVKAYHRLESYRMSIRKFDLLYTNFPASEFMEEALYIQALNYLLINALDRSQDYLELLDEQFPGSDYQAETLIVSGDNFFSMRDWERAAESFLAYQDKYPDAKNRSNIALKLARCYWWQKDYQAAAEALQEVSQESASADLAFRARLLRARVHVRMGDFEVVEVLLDALDAEAELYSSQGAVVLARAESLMAQGRGDEASPLIENMPKEWSKPIIKARGAEILGMLYLERNMLEEANEQYKQAVRKPKYLLEEDRSRRLSVTLTDYLNAEKALPNAKGERVANLQLTRANALLFGFDRPRDAADIYQIAAADTAASDATRARALYGVHITFRDYLDLPDSAALFREELTARYPDSPQAFEAAQGHDSDLLGFLMAQRSALQAENLANLSPEELAALTSSMAAGSSGRPGARTGRSGVRRRKIFLVRRSPILLEPTADEIARAASRADANALRADAAAEEIRQFDAQLQQQLDEQNARGLGVGATTALPDSTALLPGLTPLTAAPDSARIAAEKAAAEAEAAKKKKEEEEEEEDDSFDLR